MSDPYPGTNPEDPGRRPQAGPPPAYPTPEQPGRRPRPPMPAVVNYLSIGLFVLIAVQALGAVFALVNMESSIDTAVSSLPASSEVSREQAESLARLGIIASVVVALVIAALFAWLTIMIRKARNWARITVTVLLALGILIGLLSVSGMAGGTSVLGVVTLVLQIAILVMLWLNPSNEYFRRASRSG